MVDSLRWMAQGGLGSGVFDHDQKQVQITVVENLPGRRHPHEYDSTVLRKIGETELVTYVH